MSDEPPGETAISSSGVLATVYGLWLCYAAGLEYLLLTDDPVRARHRCVYMMARREHGSGCSPPSRRLIALAIVTAAARLALPGRTS